jgi:hypothetical protein
MLKRLGRQGVNREEVFEALRLDDLDVFKILFENLGNNLKSEVEASPFENPRAKSLLARQLSIRRPPGNLAFFRRLASDATFLDEGDTEVTKRRRSGQLPSKLAKFTRSPGPRNGGLRCRRLRPGAARPPSRADIAPEAARWVSMVGSPTIIRRDM